MDLLGDLGDKDQLTAARAENKVLQDKLQELILRLREVTLEKELLSIELKECQEQLQRLHSTSVEEGETFEPRVAKQSLAANDSSTSIAAFLTSGNGKYPRKEALTLRHMHGPSVNPLACALSQDGLVLATGGADNVLALLPWEMAFVTEKSVEDDTSSLVSRALRVYCSAPVIAVAFSDGVRPIAAAGCMDGSVQLVHYEHVTASSLENSGSSCDLLLRCVHTTMVPHKHSKYVKTLAWRNHMLATGSADGTVHVYRVTKTLDETISVAFLKSLHLAGSVEAMAFCGHNLVVYARGTPHLHYFDTTDDAFTPTRINLNTAAASKTGTGGFDDHVSYCILHMVPSHNMKYLAAATDSSRNMILDAETGNILRDLYGHQNDSYSQPKVAWSANDQYLMGSTQDSGKVLVWDIATSRIVDQLEGHAQPVRDIQCSDRDVLVTVSYDRTVRVWETPGSDE